VHVKAGHVATRNSHPHEQFLLVRSGAGAKNSNGYRGIGGTGVCMGDPSEGSTVTQHPGQPSNLYQPEGDAALSWNQPCNLSCGDGR